MLQVPALLSIAVREQKHFRKGTNNHVSIASIFLNVGGRLFETTTTTLESSGRPKCFAALLGVQTLLVPHWRVPRLLLRLPRAASVIARKKKKHRRQLPFSLIAIQKSSQMYLFYFMRRGTIHAKTKHVLHVLKSSKQMQLFYRQQSCFSLHREPFFHSESPCRIAR